MNRPYDFGEGFQRKILALAIRSDLLVKAPNAFRAEFFGDQSKAQSPRYRLARIVEDFSKTTRNERPGTETMDELVRRESLRLKPAEREAFEAEWTIIRTIEVPDSEFVIGEVRSWAKDAALASAIMKAADLIEATRRAGRQDQLSEIRPMIDEAMLVGEQEGRAGMQYLRDEHVGIWVEDYTRRKITTGWRKLDLALDGGPQRSEVFYILAPPKGAKSSCLINLALNASRARKGVAFFSYEMRLEAVVRRMDRNLTRSTKRDLREGPELLSHAVRGMKAAGAGEIWVQEFSARKQGIEEAARIVERRRGMGHDIEVLVLDYLNIMAPGKAERERRHELTRISRDISSVAKELDVVVWSAALVNRQAVAKERIKKTDIAEAFEVIAVADGVVAVCAPETLRRHNQRRLFLAALREEEDERDAGLYYVDLDRMHFKELQELDTPSEEAVEQAKQEGGVDYTLKKGDKQ